MSDNLWEELLSVVILNFTIRTDPHEGSPHWAISSCVLPVHLGRGDISAFVSTRGTLAWPCTCACLCACALSLGRALNCTLPCPKGLGLSFYELLDLLLLGSWGFPVLMSFVLDLWFSLAHRGASYCFKAFNLDVSFIFPSFGLFNHGVWHSCESCAFVQIEVIDFWFVEFSVGSCTFAPKPKIITQEALLSNFLHLLLLNLK